jgi:hypothetical protein
MQINFADCYVLINNRTKAFITTFLDVFLLHRQEVATSYQIPQYAEQPQHVFDTADELINYLEHNKNEKNAIYWLNRQPSTLRGAMCIFTSDGQVILGLYCETLRPDTRIETAYLQQLQQFCNATTGLIEYENPAPEDTAEFRQRLKARGHMR